MTQPRPGRHGYACLCSDTCKARHARYQRYRRHAQHSGQVAAGAPTDGTGTRRRIRALMAIGWPPTAIAASSGVGLTTIHRAEYAKRVNNATAAAVAKAYADLADTPGPSSQVRERARRARWAPPIAWDDDTIDNPATKPYAGEPVTIDPVVVERCLSGDTAKAKRAERLEVARIWTEAGRPLEELNRWHGWNLGRDRREQDAADRESAAA